MPFLYDDLGLPGKRVNKGYNTEGGFGVTNPGAAPASGGGQNDNGLHGPGDINFDLTNPGQDINTIQTESGDVLTGLKSFLFGTDRPDQKGHHGGLLNVGDVPVLGDALRFTSEVAANALNIPAKAVGAVTDVVGGTLERLPAEGAVLGKIEEGFNALPDDFPPKKDALAKMAADTGIFGTGMLPAKYHYMDAALKAYEDQTANNSKPNLLNGLYRPAASLADEAVNLFGLLGVPQRGVERLIAGAGRPGSGGLNQLQMVMAVGNGDATWSDGTTTLTPVERSVFENYSANRWTESEALDFLAGHGAGLSHDQRLEIAGTFATDPTIAVSIAAAGAAKLGAAGVKLLQYERDAQAAMQAANLTGDAEKIATAAKELKAAQEAALAVKGNVATANVVGQFAASPAGRSVGKLAGTVYEGLDGTVAGKIARAVRVAADPMQVIGLPGRPAAALEQGSHEVTEAVVSTHGRLNHDEVIYDLAKSLGDDAAGRDVVLNLFADGLSTYSANVLRRVMGRAYRATQLLTATGAAKLIEAASNSGFGPAAMAKDMIANLNKRSLVQLEEEANRFVRRGKWADEDVQQLAQRMAKLWKYKEADEWYAVIKDWNGAKLSLAHAATYGSGVTQLHEVLGAVRAAGETGTLADKFHRFILINKQTLTDLGAQGILKRLGEKAGDTKAQMDEVMAMRSKYVELRNFPVDPTSQSRTISEFAAFVEKKVPHLPAQVTDAERAGFAPMLKEFDDATRDVFTIGFRPEDRFLWGMTELPNGGWRPFVDPWMDQVSTATDALQQYMPVREMSYNVAGKPLGPVLQAGAKMLDYTEAMARTAMHGVTGTMVADSAHARFIENTHARWGSGLSADMADETAGMSKSQLESIWQAIMDRVRDSNDLSGARGLGEGGIWKAAEKVIPSYAREVGLDRRALMTEVLKAYDGDTRYIGLTQKFSGKAKLFWYEATGHNTMGEVAEHVWPMLKFRLSPLFQVQEKIEPWILNAQRGITPAIGTKMTEEDRLTAALYNNFVNKSVINMSDTDIAELAARFNIGKDVLRAAEQDGTAMNLLRDKIEALANVQGVKQVNMLRTFRHGLGKQMRAAWDANSPGDWDKMLSDAQLKAGHLLSEDDFAIRFAAENLAANDIAVRQIMNKAGKITGTEFHYANAIKVGMWSAPAHLGELRALDIEHMAYNLALVDSRGTVLRTEQELRESLAAGNIHMEDVLRGLRSRQADPDYQRRVESALTFNYPEFWNRAQVAFNLTPAERNGFDDFFRRIAEMRGMTPAEYVSQVWSPQFLHGTDFAIGSLGAILDPLRAGSLANAPDLARLATIDGHATASDLFRQLGAIMSQHLDPSAKRAFLMQMVDPQALGGLGAMSRNGEVLTSLDEINAMWESRGTDAMSEALMNFVRGTPGTGQFVPVADLNTGVSYIRDGAAELLNTSGRPRQIQRVIYADNDDLALELAHARNDLPETFSAATDADLAAQVTKQGVKDVASQQVIREAHVRSEFVTLDQLTREAYQTYGLESRRLYRYMTDTMGIDVRPVRSNRPYNSAAAMRRDLDRHILKVPMSGYGHPVFKPEDSFIQRAVQEVFGYGQEEVEFGAHHAAMSAAAMYSDEARSVYLNDMFASKAWETHSDDVVPHIVEEPTTAAEYEARRGRLDHAVTADYTVLRPGQDPKTAIQNVRIVTRPLGPGARRASPEVQRALVSTLASYDSQFPLVPVSSVDIVPDLVAAGATLPAPDFSEVSITLREGSGWQSDEAARTLTHESRRATNEIDRHWHTFDDVTDRRSVVGRPYLVGQTAVSDLWHELGHAVDVYLHHQYAKRAAAKTGAAIGDAAEPGRYIHTRLDGLMYEFNHGDGLAADSTSEAKRHLSEYAFNKTGEDPTFALTDSDAFAELFDLAFNPEHSEFVLGTEIHPQLQEYVLNFRKELRDAGVWVPDGTPVVDHAFGGMTVAQANAAGAGITASPRIGRVPQDLVDRLSATYLGTGRFSQANPDIARMAAYFRDQTQALTAFAMREGEASGLGEILNYFSGMPIVDAVPYDFTQAKLWDAAVGSMAAKWQDAFRLQYFAQNRSMFQRSLNHPMFGLYPASYMWGKIGPELIKFMALEPFGTKTGAMMKSIADVQAAVATQRQWDPAFQKKIDELGNNAALSFLGYLLPATPWEVPSSYPSWVRDFAQQGLEANQAAAVGGAIKDADFVSPLTKSLGKVWPLVTTHLPMMERAAKQAGPIVNGIIGNSGNAVPKVLPVAVPTTPDLTQPVAGADLGDALQDQVQSLRDWLGGNGQ